MSSGSTRSGLHLIAQLRHRAEPRQCPKLHHRQPASQAFGRELTVFSQTPCSRANRYSEWVLQLGPGRGLNQKIVAHKSPFVNNRCNVRVQLDDGNWRFRARNW